MKKPTRHIFFLWGKTVSFLLCVWKTDLVVFLVRCCSFVFTVKTVIMNPLLYLRKIILTLNCISKINRKYGSLIKKKVMEMPLIPDMISKYSSYEDKYAYYLNQQNLPRHKRRPWLISHNFISGNNTFSKEKLNRHCHNLFKIHMIKLYVLWLFGERNVNIEKHFPDVKKLPLWKTLISSNSFMAHRFLNPCKAVIIHIIHPTWILKVCNTPGTICLPSSRDATEISLRPREYVKNKEITNCFWKSPHCLLFQSKKMDTRWLGISDLLIPSPILRVICKSNNENVTRKSFWGKIHEPLWFSKESLCQNI